VVTTFDQDDYVLDAIAAGARGFLLKRCSGADLVRAVRAVADGDSILSPEVTRAVLARVRAAGPHGAQDLSSYGLSPREADVLALIGLGLNNTEIAARLHLSTSTVKTHVGSVLAKTHSRDRVQAALLASRAGLLPS
jgi:DNA-binding NarL/FixJ family response regulator